MGSAGLGEPGPSLSSGPLPLETVLKELAPGIQKGHSLEFWNSKGFQYVVTGSLIKEGKAVPFAAACLCLWAACSSFRVLWNPQCHKEQGVWSLWMWTFQEFRGQVGQSLDGGHSTWLAP